MNKFTKKVNDDINALSASIGNSSANIYDETEYYITTNKEYLWFLYANESVEDGENPTESEFNFWLDCFAQEVREKAYFNYRVNPIQ